MRARGRRPAPSVLAVFAGGPRKVARDVASNRMEGATMRLAIFDIDGTLTETNEVDSVCFVRALADAHAVGEMDTDWGGYAHTTDSFITQEILRTRFGRPPDEGEMASSRRRFVALLEAERARDAA